MVPEVPRGVLEAVHVAGMLALKVLHEAGDGSFSQGFQQEVNMVGHEAEGMDADFVAPRQDVEPVEVDDGVSGTEEGPLALGAALVDVIDLSALPVANTGRVGLRSHTE